MNDQLKLRPLEREDLRFVHDLDNNESVMHYWFEEPYEAYVELCDLYDKHIHDQTERRFIVESEGTSIGLVELVEGLALLVKDLLHARDGPVRGLRDHPQERTRQERRGQAAAEQHALPPRPGLARAFPRPAFDVHVFPPRASRRRLPRQRRRV